MASTNKTTNLGLNNWTETDCPKRTDFVSDNLIIDRLVGNHIKDTSLHLTASEKDRISNPVDVMTYYGTGEGNATIMLNYIPKLVIACKKNSPLQTVANNVTVMHSGIASTIGTTGGLQISDKIVKAYENSTATNGVRYALNTYGEEYLLITYR